MSKIPTYQLLEKLEQLDFFDDLLTSGVIGCNWLDYKTIFEFYQNEVKKMTLNKTLSAGELRSARRVAKTTTADEFKIGESSVYQIIQKMS